MLNRLILRNFKGFDQHELELRSFTVAVGQNNAGKSTLVEALRLVSIVTHRYRGLSYHRPPNWADLPRRDFGVSPSLRGADLNFSTLFHRYGPGPAEVEAIFETGEAVSIRLGGSQEVHAVIRNPDGRAARSKAEAGRTRLPLVSAMPQLSPVLAEESVLTEEHVRSNLSSSLSSRHFRNQLKLFGQYFEEFRAIAEENWPRLKIMTMDQSGRGPDAQLLLQVRNQDFVGEIGMMGYGLQMWLQVIWFIARSHGAYTVILDEPDVYMHPDLQRRLVRFLKTRFQQIIITTHSVEIMSEVRPDQILVVDRRHSNSNFADSLEAVQRVLSGLGSAQNIHLTRLWSAKRLLLVEGRDIRILGCIHDLLFPESDSFEQIPSLQIGGWGGWQFAVGSSMTFRNAMGQDITPYCVFDSDYRTPSQLAARKQEARKRGVQLHIWSRKEIENFLLIPAVIARVIADRVQSGDGPGAELVFDKVVALADQHEDELLDNLAAEYAAENRGDGPQRANQKARERIQDSRDRDGNLLALVGGKELLSELSVWSSREFGVSFGLGAILNAVRLTEVPEELGKVVTAIEYGWALEEDGA